MKAFDFSSQESIRDIIKNNIEIDTLTGCWNWKRIRDKEGYGVIKSMRAHRVSHMAFNDNDFKILNTTPGENYVCHRCDNKSCVNPEHLFVGDNRDNQEDYAIKKGKLQTLSKRMINRRWKDGWNKRNKGKVFKLVPINFKFNFENIK